MKGGGQQGQSGSGSMDVLWISAFFVLLLAYIWYAHSDLVMNAAYQLNYFKLKVASKFFLWLQKTGLINVDLQVQQLEKAFVDVRSLLGSSAGIKELHDFTSEANGFFSYIYAVLVGIYTIFLIFFSKANNFKKTFSMKKLRDQEKDNWPYITPVANNLIKVDLDEGPWAMSIQPLQFILNNDLADKEPVYGQVKLTLRDNEVYENFSRQMGVFWTGKLDCMPNYTKAVFAIFAAKGNGDDAGARKLIDQIASSAGSGSLNFSGSTMLIAKHIRAKGVGRAVSPHAYLLTAMASMLEYARTGGVVAMAEMIWLKKVDRRLWYMLQSVGRQTPFVEAAAAYAHWIVEKRLRRPLKVPMVNEAVKAMVKSLEDIKYNPEGY